MNFVFISPHFPPNFSQFGIALRAKGANVLGIGDAPHHELRPDLRAALSEYFLVHDMNHYESMYRALAHLAARHGRIDRIESMNEHWLGIEAELRRDFNVPGPQSSDLHRLRSKMGMKDVFRHHGIPCADGEKVANEKQLERFVARVGYPVIFKPEVGVGASQTSVISTFEELKPHLERPPQGFVVEELLKGELVSFDGLTGRNGEILFWTSMAVNAGIMQIVQQRLEMSYRFRRQVPATLEALGRKTVEAFDLRERFFHIEFFREAENQYTALEVNVRPPGGYSLDMMNFQCDFDLYHMYADLVVNNRTPEPAERKFCVAHASRRHGHTYRYTHDELLHRLAGRLMAHLRVPDVFSPAMGNYTYLIRDPDEASLIEAIAMVQERG